MWDLKRIKRIDLEITSYCNIRCSGCSRESTTNREHFLNKRENMITLEMFKERFKPEDLPGLKTFNFCGSIDEPMSHPDIIGFVKYIREQWGPKLNISISTNGSIRTPKFWKEFGELMAGTHHSVIWGVDGADKTSEIYREGSDFEKVRANWRAFNAAGGRSIWQFIIMEHNKHQVDGMEELAIEEGFKAVKFINSMREQGNVEYVKHEVEESEEVECRYLTEGSLFVNSMGDVIPCCYVNPEHLESSTHIPYKNNNPMRTAYVDTWKEHGGQLATNLRYNDLVDVVEGDFFDAVAESWNQRPLFDRCEQFCKKKKQAKFTKIQVAE